MYYHQVSHVVYHLLWEPEVASSNLVAPTRFQIQLVALICGELFLFNWQRFTAFQRLRFASSNGGSHFANLICYSC